MRNILILWLAIGAVPPGGASAAEPAAAAAATAKTTDAVAVEVAPAWIRDRAVPAATKANDDAAENGLAHLLVDEQYRPRADGHDDWFRWAGKVTNRSGLEAAGLISISYNPAFETAGVAFVHLIRDGKLIDLTKETQFRIVEREAELDDGIVSGTVKAIANIRGVRVGDVVDHGTIIHTRTELWPGAAFYGFYQRYSDALALRAIRFVWPAGMVPRAKPLNSDVAFASRVTADGTEWEWTSRDTPALRGEADVPAGAFQWGQVDVTTMADWAELARRTAKLYDGDDSLPPDFAARLDAIAAASPAAGDRLTAALRLVQDTIRYVGDEMGEGSYVPRRPATVLARAFGDCKDKSLLLAVALRRLGIDAVPALVSTSAGERLPDRLPSPMLFDHVIVRAVLDGKVMWLDATGSSRGGRGAAIVPADFGNALPIRAGQTALERIDGYGAHAGQETVLERFMVDEAAAVPLTLHVETHYTAARADRMRASIASGSAKKIADGNLDFYRDRFPGLTESRPLQLDDDRDANTLTMVEDYTMPRDAFRKAKIAEKLITRAYTAQDALPARQANPRVQPLALASFRVNEQTIELHVKDRVLEGLVDVDARGAGIAFSRRTRTLPDGIAMTYRLDTGTRDAVSAGEADAVYAVSDKIRDEAGIEFFIDKSPRPAAGPKGIDAATVSLIKPELEKVNALIQKPDEASRLEALGLLAAAAAKVPHPSPAAGLIDGLKAAVLAELRRPQAALAAFHSATAQFDGNPQVFRLWLAYELDLGTSESFVTALQRTRAVQPAIVTELDKHWVQAAMAKTRTLATDKREAAREDLCIVLADSGWQQTPRTSYGDAMLGCAITAHSRRGDLAAARAGLAREPGTDTLLTLAIDRRHQALWPAIDASTGDRFRASLARDAARAAAAATAAPGYATVTYQMATLRALGRFGDAVAAGKALAGDKAAIEVAGSDAFWMVNEYAANLRALGRLDDAIAALDGVLAFGEERYPELGSLAINRVEMVLAAGLNAAALDTLQQIEAGNLDHLSPYGKMWVWANTACALHALHRNEEAKAAVAKLAAKPDDNWSAVTAAAACRNDTAAIADLLIARLRASDGRAAALGLFVAFDAVEAHTPTEQAMRAAVAAARTLPAVQAEFAKAGRTVHYAGTTQGWSEF